MSQTKTTTRLDLQVLCEEDSIYQNLLKADVLSPPIGVNLPSADFNTIPAGEFMRIGNVERNEDGSFGTTGYATDTDSYKTEEFGAMERVDLTSALINSTWFDEEVQAGKLARMRIIMAREKRVADEWTDHASFPAGNKQAATALWSSASTAKPLTDIDNMSNKCRAAMGLRKNALNLVLTYDAVVAAMKSDVVRTDGKYTTNLDTLGFDSQVNYLKSYLGVRDIIVVDPMFNANGIDAGKSFDEVWDKAYAWMVLPTSISGNTFAKPAFSRQPYFRPYSPNGALKYDSWYDQLRDSNFVRAREYRGVYMNYNFGCILTGVLS